MGEKHTVFASKALQFEYRRNWVALRHYGPVALNPESGYILRCADEESLASLLIDAPHFSAVRRTDKI